MAIIHVKKRLTFQMHPPENRPNFSERYRSTVALLLSHFSALTPNSIDTSCQQQRHRQSTHGRGLDRKSQAAQCRPLGPRSQPENRYALLRRQSELRN